MFKLDLEKAEEPETKLPTSAGYDPAREFQKNIYFCFIKYTIVFDCGSQQTGNFLKRWEIQTTLPASWENCMQVKKQQLEPDMEQRTGSKLGKEYIKAVYCHPTHLTYMLCVCMLSNFSCVWLCVTLKTSPPGSCRSMGFSRQEY